jgi:PST family polysaccharide transporter
MTQFLTKLKRSEFVVAIGSTGFTAAFQILSAVIINKIISIKIGPSGIALLGQFSNFRDIMTNFGTASIGQGVTKYVADARVDEKRVISTSAILSLIVSVMLGTLSLIFSETISDILFRTDQFRYIIQIFSLSIPFFSMNNILISIVNGKRKFILLAKIKFTNSLFSLFVSSALCWFFAMDGALLAMALNTTVVFIISLIIYYSEKERFLMIRTQFFNEVILRKLLSFTFMAVTSVLLKPLVELLLRNYILYQGSEIDAGIWESMKRLSTYYNQIIFVSLGAYYLPKLSALEQNLELKNEIFAGIRRIMPMFTIIAIVIYFSRDLIIEILFSVEFAMMRPLFFPQLVGDFFMVFSFLIAYMMLAKAMTKTFIITQLLMATTRISFSIVFFDMGGIEGVIWANALNYFIYSILMIFIFREILFYK